jgi:hypothetical protein
LQQLLVVTKIVLGHSAVKRSSNRARTSHLFSSPMRSMAATASSSLSTMKHGRAFIDDFRDRTAPEGDHWRAAGHGLDHDQTERLGPIDGKKQRGPSQARPRRRTGWTEGRPKIHGSRACETERSAAAASELADNGISSLTKVPFLTAGVGKAVMIGRPWTRSIEISMV